MNSDNKRQQTRAHSRPALARLRAETYALVVRVRTAVRNGVQQVTPRLYPAWESRAGSAWRQNIHRWRSHPSAGVVVLVGGTTLLTLLAAALAGVAQPPLTAGVLYVPLIALLTYYWGWRYGVAAATLQFASVYLIFIRPMAVTNGTLLDERLVVQTLVLAGVTGLMLLLVQHAGYRRRVAEREAGRFAALATVSTALAGERDETTLLQLIAQTARSLTGAGFAAITLRPVDALGQPSVPAEGALFHLAAVIGVTKEQEALFRRMPLGGEGLLAPIFRHGMPVHVADALTAAYHTHVPEVSSGEPGATTASSTAARQAAMAYAHGLVNAEALRGVGLPGGHPVVRSFLGAPLLDHSGQVRGGLLLGHTAPNRFTREHAAMLSGLAAQAAVALENVRLFRSAQMHAQELDAIIESIADGVTVLDGEGHVLRENDAARQLRSALDLHTLSEQGTQRFSRVPAEQPLQGQGERNVPVSVSDGEGHHRDLLVSSAPLRLHAPGQNAVSLGAEPLPEGTATATVVTWHDVTDARQLIEEQQARVEIEARWALLRVVINELPIGVYLARGRDARLVLANQAASAVWGASWPVGQTMVGFLQESGTRILGTDGQPLAADQLATLRALRTGQPVRYHQEIVRHANGTTLPILFDAVTLDPDLLVGSFPDASEAGSREPIALVVLQDVTALKEAERLKDEFIAVAAHELRTPMTAMMGFAHLLQRHDTKSSGTPLDDWQLEALVSIEQATTRLVDLTDDLLDVTRLQAGRLELRLEAHDLLALTRRVVRRLQVTTPRHALTVTVAPEHVIVAIDVKRFEQVLNNVLNNSIKYSPHGGQIGIAVVEDSVTGLAQLSVHDAGIGIPADQQALLFRRFVRADNAKEQGIAGSGLGLFLCRELMERHGGHIWFESSQQHGTTFHLTLPLLASADMTAL